MLGFIIGALFVWALPRPEPDTRPIIVAHQPEQRVRTVEPRQLTTIEAVFDQWSQYAVWSNDITQVALWNSAVGDFAEYYEVLRADGTYYFRSLPHLTNRVIRHGTQPPSECPLLFTETAQQYEDWREHGRFERPAEEASPLPPVPSASGPALTPEMQERERAAPPPTPPEEHKIDVVPKP